MPPHNVLLGHILTALHPPPASIVGLIQIPSRVQVPVRVTLDTMARDPHAHCAQPALNVLAGPKIHVDWGITAWRGRACAFHVQPALTQIAMV